MLSILGVVSAIALPSYTRYASTQRARAAAHVLASDLRAAQQEAITRRHAIIVAFFAADSSCSGSPSYVLGDPRAAIKRACLPPDVAWDPVPSRPVVFHPTGASDAGAVVSVEGTRSGRRFAVSVAERTGVITEAER